VGGGGDGTKEGRKEGRKAEEDGIIMVRLMSCPPYVVVKIERIQEYRQIDSQSCR
jgi:hypothetical protein